MKYLFINSVYGVTSSGRIIAVQCRKLMAQGHECLVAYARETTEDSVPKIRIGSPADYVIHAVESRLLDNHGQASKAATKKLLARIEAYQPDVIWMHNLHGYYLNYTMLFRWLRQHPEIRKYWTLHDCWTFTGHCANFTMAKCERWRTGCGHCPQLKTYPVAVGLDHSAGNYRSKKEAFAHVRNLTLITPSQWLADLTRESFLKEYPVKVIHNTIDTELFKPAPSDFRKRHGLEKQYVLLGVAIGWDDAKGYPDMLRLREILDDSYSMVLVGLTPRQIASLPKGMIGLERTSSPKQLAEIYTAADVLVNPTHQDNYPTVNLEARACGTPVVTYDVGGSPESAGREHVVPDGDVRAMAEEIRRMREASAGRSQAGGSLS